MQRAIGRYRLPWLDLVLPCLLGTLLIFGGLIARSSVAPFSIASGVALVAFSWLVPVTIIDVRGVRLVRRFRFIDWAQVTKVFQPGPGDPDTMIELKNGERVLLPGVGRDRLPGIVALAGGHVGTPD